MAVKELFVRCLFLVFILGQVGVSHGVRVEGNSYQIHITDVNRIVHKNWLGVPRTVDCTVNWEVYEEKEGKWSPVDVSSFDSYRVVCTRKDDLADVENSDRVDGNFYTFYKRRAGKRYGFVVEGYRGDERIAVSDTAWIVTGRLRADGRPTAVIHWHHWIPFNGRIPLAIIGRESFFEGSTTAGKIAFHINWNFFLIGMVVWFGFCVRHLSLGKVFPMEKGMVVGGYDEILRRKESKQFRDILEKWRDLVVQANQNIRLELAKGDKVKIEDIEGANAQFWRDRGSEEIRGLIKHISMSGLDHFPAVKIIKAGLENHELGGFHWLEVSKEVDRAIENRASSELERLRQKSFLDWLWNLGTLAPLIGLFGTATGISHAFAMLQLLPTNITQTELVKRLSGGIYEALWTTIEGLAIGVSLMILYYYYQNKLNWIYSKWEEIYVYVSEKL